MRCISCGADIPPQWVIAIQQNSCPGCGGEIMNSVTKELLDELSTAMEKMPNDPQGIAGWLISNYRFQKMGNAEPVDKFHRKGQEKFNNIESNEFVKRSEATHLISRSNELANKLKNKGGKISELASLITSIKDPYDDNSIDDEPNSNDNQPINIDDQKVYNELKASGINPFEDSESISTNSGELSDILNNEIVLMEKNMENKRESSLSQTEEGRAFLRKEQIRQLKSQENLSNGIFRR